MNWPGRRNACLLYALLVALIGCGRRRRRQLTAKWGVPKSRGGISRGLSCRPPRLSILEQRRPVNMQVAIDVFSALLTPVIAAIAVYIAYQQSQTNRRKTRPRPL